MAPARNARVLFNEIPSGYPIPGKTTVYDDSQTIDIDGVPLNGGFLIKVLILSIDPYLRGRMRDPSIKSYSIAYTIGAPLDNFGVGVVLRSESDELKVGDHVYGYYPFQEYVVYEDIAALRLARVLKNEEGLPWSVYVGVCGLPGHTAHHGWMEFAKPKQGDVVFVTTAKQAGCKVIASAGSDEKVTILKSIGTDVAFNYKKTIDVLMKEGPIDIYRDNVGGESLDAALEVAAWHARECGMISAYNNADDYAMKNLPLIFTKSLTLYDFTVMDFHHKYADQGG
ncbi:NAD(P)-binding protein [Rhodofomes roseus]|uniref:NAD(P)-binding protein n=1 Tax=Rhodofomes roseus TaxID=34475 RepID=A0ABQ8K531_9APHY|nr:NAD(P)-binding protein [Rhodofomes roseus]KAH9832053.1 NAD(P)-binding protein [Rhodofomes roseus]